MVRSTGLDRGLSDKRPHECGNCSGHRVSGPAVDIGGSISKGGRGIEALFCGKPSLDGGSSPEGSSTRVPSYSKHSPYSSTPPHTPVGGGVVWVLYSTVNSIGGVLGGGEYWSRFSVETSIILWARTNSFSKSSFLALSKELLGRPLALFQSP
jgi:hypothetical protein